MSEEQGSSAIESKPTQNAMQIALAKALEATREPAAEPEPVTEGKADEGHETEEREREEGETLLVAEAETSEEPDADGAEVSDETEAAGASEFEAPGQWTKEAREIFATLDPDVQEVILAETKRGERLITRKSQELSDTAKRWEKFQEVMNPYRAEFTSGGLDEVGAVTNLLRIHDALKTNPAQAVAWLAQTYGAELPTAQADDDQDEYTSPSESALKKEFQRLQQQVASLQSTQQQAHATTVGQMVNNFTAAKTDSGELLHPYANEVMDDMAKLIRAGLAENLEDAYAQALVLPKNAELTKQQQQEAAEQRKREEVLKRKRAAAEARKKAKASGASGGTSAAQRGRMSPREAVMAAVNRTK